MKNNKILVLFVLFLIVVNCGLLGFFWFNAYHQKKQPVQDGPAFDYLSKELHLNTAQKIQYEKMRILHGVFADSVNDHTRMMRDSFFEYLKNPSIKPAIVNALEKKISTNMAMLDTSTFYHFSRFRAILNAGQQKKFDQIIQDVLRGMGGPQRGPRPGGGDGQPPAGPQQDERPMGPHGKGRPHPGGPPRGERPPYGRPGDDMPPPPDGGPPPGGGPPPPGGPPPK